MYVARFLLPGTNGMFGEGVETPKDYTFCRVISLLLVVGKAVTIC